MMFVSPRGGGLPVILEQMDVRPSEARSVQPPRMRIDTGLHGESWADLARRATGNTRDTKAIANLNGFDVDQPLTLGMTAKLPEEVATELI
jgi:hypothetical protein